MSEDSEERPGSFEGKGAPSWLEDINKEFGASSASSDFVTTHEVYGTSSQLGAGTGLAQAAIDDVFGSTISPHGSQTRNASPSLPPNSSFLIYLNSTLSQRTDFNSEDNKNGSSSNDEADYYRHQQPKEKEEFLYQQLDLESVLALPEKNASSSSVPSKHLSTNSQNHPTQVQDVYTMPKFPVTADDTNIRFLINTSEDGLIADYEQAKARPAQNRVSPSKTTIASQEVVNSEYRNDIYDVKTNGSDDQLLIQLSSTESKGFSHPKSCLLPSSKTSPSKGSADKPGFADLLTTKKSISFEQHTTSFEKQRSGPAQDQEKDDNSQLSGSQTDVDDLISRFTENKPSMDDLDDILGPMDTESFDRHAAAIAKTSSYSPRKAASTTPLVDTIAEVAMPKSSAASVPDSSTVLLANQNELRTYRDNRNQATHPYPAYRDGDRPGETLATMKWDKELATSLAAPPCPPPKVYATSVVPPVASNLASQPPPESPLDRIVASLEKNLPPMGPAKKHHKRRPPAINSMTSDSTGGSYSTGTGTGAGSFDSSSSETSPSDALGSALSKDSSSSFWASSGGTGTSRDASFASPGTLDTGSLRSTGNTASRSPGGTTTSPSASTGRSSSPCTTVGSPSTLGNVTRSQDSLTRDETCTSGGSGTNLGDLSTQGDNSTQMGASMSGSFGLRPMSTSRSDHQEPYAINASHTSRSDQQEKSSTIHYDSSNTSTESEEPRSVHRQAAGQSGGSRMWELANKEVARSKSRDAPLTPEASKFAESLMARTRSRAEPDAVINSSDSQDYQEEDRRPAMIRLGDTEDAFIMNTAIARKRVRVVQLLIVGLVGLLLGLLGSLYVQSSCHFVSAQEEGQNSEAFALHYGLWKYSPMESAFQGYSYCYGYDRVYDSDAPTFPRWASLLALMGGSFSLSVLWFYLIMGRSNEIVWRLSVVSAGLSGLLQLCTLFFLWGDVCDRGACTLGPAGVLSVVASFIWFILGFEMHYNTPLPAWVSGFSGRAHIEPRILVANLEMTDLKDGAKAYVRRIVQGEDASPYPTLNQIQRDNVLPMGEVMLGKPDLHYKPPPFIV